MLGEVRGTQDQLTVDALHAPSSPLLRALSEVLVAGYDLPLTANPSGVSGVWVHDLAGLPQ